MTAPPDSLATPTAPSLPAPAPEPAIRHRPGETLPARMLHDIAGRPVPVPDPERLVHLQFRRFAGCPICNLHLRGFVRAHERIAAAGIREVVVFHSSAEALQRHAGDLPFAAIPDPQKRHYAAFGVEQGPRALLAPAAMLAILRAVADVGARAILRRRNPPPVLPPLLPAGGRLGLPADFLIGSDGRILACRYGRHADDQWSVDELLAAAAAMGG